MTVGNADAQLDPGEVWTYAASAPEVLGFAGVVASAMTPTNVTVTAQNSVIYTLQSPLSGSATTATTAVVAGTAVQWQGACQNVASFSVTSSNAEARVLDPRSGVVSFSGLTPVSKGVDGDDVMAPGETWRWQFTAPVTTAGSYLSAALGFKTVDGSGAFATREVRSAPIAVTPIAPPTSTTTPVAGPRTLPTTGQGTAGIAWFAHQSPRPWHAGMGCRTTTRRD